jgi:methionyl-tRNA formyltransferase
MVMTALRVVFFGTPAFAVPTLEALLRSSHRVAAVVTQPDRPSGRGQKTTDSPVKARAIAAGLPVLQPARLKDPATLEALQATAADIGVVAAYGRLVPPSLLEWPRLGLINVHASLLPRHRGAAPVHRAILAGDAETGVTIMRLVEALDAGPMLAARRLTIGADETSTDVETSLAALGATLLVDTLDRMTTGAIAEEPQDDALATYAPRLTKADSPVNWMRAATEVHNQIRGLHPWPLAESWLRGDRLILRRSAVSPVSDDTAQPGTIVSAHGDDLIVSTADGLVRLLELQREGKRPMSVRDFLSGHAVVPGERLTASR